MLYITGYDKETILSHNHLFTASEVCFLRTGDLEEDKMPRNNVTLLRGNNEYSFLMRNCSAAASASNYGEFQVFLFPKNSINNLTTSFTKLNMKPLPLPAT